MKKTAQKWLAILPLALLGITMAGTPIIPMPAYAASEKSFSDVPAGHWAYDAVEKLAQAGIVDGYGDNSFKGDKTISRYEFAFITAKAMEKFDTAGESNQELIDQLSSEFAAELNRLGARVTKVETKTNTWVGGETRMRIVQNDSNRGGKKLGGADHFDFRQRFKFWGNVNDNISWAGRISTSTSNKFGDAESATGSDVNLDLMTVSAKDTFGFDNIRIGRSALDFYTNGIFGKAGNVDGVYINKKWGDVNFRGWTGNIKSSATNDANQLTTGEVDFKLADNLNLKAGYYAADVEGTSTTAGTGTLNTNTGRFDSSQGWTAGMKYKFGKYTLLGDYVSTTLDGATNLPKHPKGWAVQVSNSQGPAALYPAVNLVNPAKVGTDAWMVSYRNIDAGTIPSGAGAFDVTAVADPTQPYSVFTHGTDNEKVLFLAYQNVIAKNVLVSLEYQDFKIKNRGLTNLPSDRLDKTYMMKLEFFY